MPGFLKFLGNVAGALLPGVGNVISNSIGARQQEKANKRMAAQQHGYNMELLKYQLDYNSPSSQMQRYRDAGLNENLIYGQGTPGNMDSPPKYPELRAGDYQGALANLGTQVQQARYLSAQTDLTKQKVDESGVKQDLMRAQRNLVAANPYLNKSYVDAMVLNLQSVAKIKQQEAVVQPINQAKAIEKIQHEINLLSQRFNLGEQDKQIKAKIIESKEFQNQIQQIQVNWLKDGDITPQHIFQGIMLLLQKMM